MSRYLFFYSNLDENSKKLISIINKAGIFEDFNFICVDRDRKTGLRTRYVETYKVGHVPLIIANNKKYYGVHSINWLKKLISDTGLSGSRSMDSRNQRGPPEAIEDGGSGYSNLGNEGEDEVFEAQLNHTILPPEIALETDLRISKGKTDKAPKNQQGLKKDKLKEKQKNNNYSKLLQDMSMDDIY